MRLSSSSADSQAAATTPGRAWALMGFILGWCLTAPGEGLSWSDELIQSSSPNTAESEAIGTPPRNEVETKLALHGAEAISASALSRHLHQLLVTHLQEKGLQFATAAGCTPKVDPSIQSFAFIDEYFDTPGQDLLGSGSAYRLRRRWQNYQHYLRHRLFVWSQLFPPTRVEIQAKVGYQATGSKQLSVAESRLEFRLDSPPFNQGFPLPRLNRSADARLHEIMTTGHLDQHPTYPFVALKTHPPLAHAPLSTLKHVLTLASRRNRFHISCPHPLGWGPNPEQVFIVTIDEVRCLSDCCGADELLTIELERERNTTTYLDEFALYTSSPYLTHPIAKLGLAFASTLRHAHHQDHHQLTTGLETFIHAQGWTIQSPSPKYQRFSC